MTLANQILMNVSYVLFERVVNTQINPAGVAIAPGVVTVTPGSMDGIYVGAKLIAGVGTANQEIVVVSGVMPTTFTAVYAKAHAPTDLIQGGTFSAGQPDQFSSGPTDNPLFTQDEILGYVADVQNKFLLRTECICAVTTQPMKVGNRYYPIPVDAIRIERISVNGVELWSTSQADIDMMPTSGKTNSWFYDETPNSFQFGVSPTPQIGDTMEIWYTQRAATSLVLTDALLVPDPLAYIIELGVLARIFSKDGDQRDPMKAEYCEKRFENDTVLVQVLIGETDTTTGRPDSKGMMAQQV